jgi:hypothetical protein
MASFSLLEGTRPTSMVPTWREASAWLKATNGISSPRRCSAKASRVRPIRAGSWLSAARLEKWLAKVFRSRRCGSPSSPTKLLGAPNSRRVGAQVCRFEKQSAPSPWTKAFAFSPASTTSLRCPARTRKIGPSWRCCAVRKPSGSAAIATALPRTGGPGARGGRGAGEATMRVALLDAYRVEDTAGAGLGASGGQPPLGSEYTRDTRFRASDPYVSGHLRPEVGLSSPVRLSIPDPRAQGLGSTAACAPSAASSSPTTCAA